MEARVSKLESSARGYGDRCSVNVRLAIMFEQCSAGGFGINSPDLSLM
jgi:hypothetical protein